MVMRIVPTPSLSNKVATGVDIAATLAIEQIGYTLSIPAWHPVMLGAVLGMTWALFKYKDDVTVAFVDLLDPIQNKNFYSFQGVEPAVLYNKKKRELRMKSNGPKRPMKPVLYV
jgi:hypothetical protein